MFLSHHCSSRVRVSLQHYFTDAWCQLDFFLVVTAAIDEFASSLLESIGGASQMRILRVLRVLRIIRLLKGAKELKRAAHIPLVQVTQPLLGEVVNICQLCVGMLRRLERLHVRADPRVQCELLPRLDNILCIIRLGSCVTSVSFVCSVRTLCENFVSKGIGIYMESRHARGITHRAP